MSRYLVVTKNVAYDRKTYGVQFSNGKAIVDENTIDENLGWTVEQVAELMRRDFRYKVRPLRDSPKIQAALEDAELVDSGGLGENAAEPQPPEAPADPAPRQARKRGRPKKPAAKGVENVD